MQPREIVRPRVSLTFEALKDRDLRDSEGEHARVLLRRYLPRRIERTLP